MPDDPTELLPLKPLEFSILVALSEEERYGYALSKRLAEDALGAIALAPGNLYQVLDRMIERGLIEERDRTDPEDGRRRWYGVTPWGRRVAAAEAARLRAVVRTADGLGLTGEGMDGGRRS